MLYSLETKSNDKYKWVKNQTSTGGYVVCPAACKCTRKLYGFCPQLRDCAHIYNTSVHSGKKPRSNC